VSDQTQTLVISHDAYSKGRQWALLAGVQCTGSGGRKSLSGVQGQSPVRESEGRRPPEAGTHTAIFCRKNRARLAV